MIEQEQRRFDMLRLGRCMPPEYARDYFGISWPLPEDVCRDYDAWASRLKRPSSCGEGQISRYELESFFQQKNVPPKAEYECEKTGFLACYRRNWRSARSVRTSRVFIGTNE